MFDFEDILSRLLRGNVSPAELSSLSSFFQIKNFQEAEESRKKYLVQRDVLKHLLRDKVDDEELLEQLKETEGWLYITRRDAGYSCSYIGCSFKTSRHLGYINHLKSSHFLSDNILCNFRHTCKRRFTSFSDLMNHVNSEHSKKTSSNTDQHRPSGNIVETFEPCKCLMPSCGQRHFSSIKQLKLHYSSKAHNDEERPCLFSGCNVIFSPGYRASQHFRRKHRALAEQCLKPEHLIHGQFEDEDNSHVHEDVEDFNEDFSEGEDNDQVNDNGDECMTSDDASDADAFQFLKAYADFVNRMHTHHMIPASTIQIMITEFNSLMEKAVELTKVKVSKRLKQENVGENVIAKVMLEMNNNDVLKAYEELNTPHKRDMFIRRHFKHTPSKEIILNEDGIKRGEKKESFQFISVIDGIKNLFEDETFIKALEESKSSERDNNDVFAEFRDGDLIKAIPHYQNNPSSYVGFLYSDAVELVSPLGSGRGRSKIVQMFWTIGDLDKRFRSKVDQINLAVVCQNTLLKKYGYKRIYAELIKEIRILETEGVVVEFPFKRRIRISFPIHLGDNLECHQLGGFSACFSSKDICRCCHIQYDQLETRIHNYTSEGEFDYWSMEEYDEITQHLNDIEPQQPVITQDNLFDEIDEPLVVCNNDFQSDDEAEDQHDTASALQYGLRERCCLNQIASFHACYSFPLDILHDVCEGVISEDLQGVLKTLVDKGFFSESDYNSALKKFEFKGSDANDKPENFDVKKTKVRGKAMSILVHLKNFGLIIHSLKPRPEIYEEESLMLALRLSSLVEVLMSPLVRKYEVIQLEEEIISYLDLRSKLYNEYPNSFNKPKPKTHYLSHYPNAILLYGPLTGCWTARYESKHRVAKMLSISGKNYKNISKLIAERQQLRQASVYYHGMFPSEQAELPVKVLRKHEIPVGSSNVQAMIKDFMDESSLWMNSISLKSQEYRCEDILVLKVIHKDVLRVGVIQAIIYKESQAFFLVAKYLASRHQHLQFFEASSKGNPELSFVQAEKIGDYKPLIKHGSEKRFNFALHHRISVDPEKLGFEESCYVLDEIGMSAQPQP